MCGFFTIVFDRERGDLGDLLKNAGHRLSYRGYDSTGIAVFGKNGKLTIKKDKGNVERVADKLDFSKCSGYKGIIQLRWATYGKPSKINSQPHKDCTGNYVSAHNGNIINVHELFESLREKGHNIRSENDGEVIVHILEEYLKKYDIKEAVKKAYNDIKGDYAYCFTEKHEHSIIAVKKGSSLFAGKGDGFFVVSSDLYAVLDHTDNILQIKDGEMIYFDAHKFKLFDISTGKRIRRNAARNSISPAQAYKDPYDSFMEKEINEVPVKIASLREYYVSSDMLSELTKMLSRREIIITGSGTSYNAAYLGTYFLNRIAGRDVRIFLPSDINDRFRYFHNGKPALMAVSQSGETKDIKNAIDAFRAFSKGKVVGIINNIGSSIAMMSDMILPTISDMEVSVPATKTFINQVVLFYMIAMEMDGMKRNEINRKINELIKAIKSTEVYEKELDSIAERLYKRKNMHILGYSLTLPCAMEAALKMKEVTYINVEAMHSSEFKHGPLAIINRNYPVILISSAADKHYTLSHINEIRTRNGFVITVSQKDKLLRQNSDMNIEIDQGDEYIFAILSVYLMQKLSMKVAYRKGIDPDKPKNISKTITVD